MGQYDLNTDGCCYKNTHVTRAGGIIQDHQSSWILGFIKLEVYLVIEAELWTLTHEVEAYGCSGDRFQAFGCKFTKEVFHNTPKGLTH